MSASAYGIPFQAHSATSKSAARAIAPKAPTMEDKVYDFIKKQGLDGATDEEIYYHFQQHISHWTKESTVRARRVRLVELKRVQESALIRFTKAGRKAVVWVAV